MEQGKREKNEFWEWTKTLIIAFAIAWGVRFFLFAPIVVDGESMMPTLENGDRMIVNKIGHTVGELNRYDIVIFHASEDKDYIKRVIGLPGDHIAYEDDRLFINGKAQKEPYLSPLKDRLRSDGGPLTKDFTLEELTGMKVIPEGFVFVLGDNRRNSTDSRIIGLVPIKEIIGSAKYVFWPISDMGSVD